MFHLAEGEWHLIKGSQEDYTVGRGTEKNMLSLYKMIGPHGKPARLPHDARSKHLVVKNISLRKQNTKGAFSETAAKQIYVPGTKPR